MADENQIKNLFTNIGTITTKTKKAVKNFLYNNFEVTSTKKSLITGSIIAFVLELFVVINNSSFTKLAYETKWLLLASAMVLPFIIFFLITYRIKIKNDLANKILHLVSLFIFPLITITMTEALNSVFIYDMTALGFLGNYILVTLLYFIFYAVTGGFKVPIIVVNSILYGLAVAHCYIMEFRGTPFIPMDFFSITTALNVANTYEFSFMHTVIIGTMLFIVMLVIGIKIKTPDFHKLTKIISRTFTGCFFTVVMVLFYFTSIFADAGIKPDFWNQSRGYKNYGFSLNFFLNTKYLFMSQPSNYDPNAIGDYVSEKVEENTTVETPENAPNIICIMNESLSDLSVLGNFTTNEDYMPFMRSLTENTIKGNLYVPVIGAGTSNSEFEFLTGHSTAFLPSGSNAYMLYIKNPIATLVSTLEGQGYSSFALHPYYASGWNRVSVYNNMGFNVFKSLENIIDISLMDQYMDNSSNPDYLNELIEQTYPGRNMLLRQYISDSYNYKLIIEDFENRDKSVPYFVFNVTMQNHGGYTSSCVNFNESIYVTSSTNTYNKANKYLSLVKESDNAFKELIEYFSNVDEPTVICMFGDHQPSIERSFIAEALGVSNLDNLTLEQEQKRHVTPFIIWANYDIPEAQIDKLSVNYLSSYLLSVSGVKLTEYNKYLLKLSETLPVIDTVGYIDSQNNYYKWGDTSEYTDLLNEYERIQYNNIFDSDNKNLDIFYLEGYKGDEGTNPDERSDETE